jgi:hypothetical protein
MDTDELDYCDKCGVYFNIYKIKRVETEDDCYNSRTYICPVCKHVMRRCD